jgi:topoisomerase-4 subunit A
MKAMGNRLSPHEVKNIEILHLPVEEQEYDVVVEEVPDITLSVQEASELNQATAVSVSVSDSEENDDDTPGSVNELAETSEIDDSDIATKFDILPEAQIDSFKETESESASEYLEEETISDPEILPEIQIESSKESGSSAKAKKSDLSAEAASERVSDVQDENVKEPEKPVKKIDFEITNPDDLDIDDKGQIGLF